MKISILITFCVIFLSGCIKEKSTYYEAKIINNSGVAVEIVPYKSGVPNYSKKIALNNYDSFIVAQGTDRGIVNHAGFSSEYFSNVDFLIVKFNDFDSIFHYINLPESIPDEQKYYEYSNDRNVLNMYSYQYSHKDVSKGRREAYYIYTFTESDYEFAKD